MLEFICCMPARRNSIWESASVANHGKKSTEHVCSSHSLLALLRRLNDLIPAAKGELQSSSELQQRAGGCHQQKISQQHRTNRWCAQRYWFKLSASFPYSALHTARRNLFASSLSLCVFCLFPREQLLFHLQKRQQSECLCMRAFTSAHSLVRSLSQLCLEYIWLSD